MTTPSPIHTGLSLFGSSFQDLGLGCSFGFAIVFTRKSTPKQSYPGWAKSSRSKDGVSENC
jgi:hypothetical protein